MRTNRLVLLTIVLCSVLLCSANPIPPADIQTAMDYPGVVGYGISASGPVILLEDDDVFIPLALQRFDTMVIGRIYRLDMLDAVPMDRSQYAERYRPVQAGVSVGHYLITAGTLGSIVYDGSDGTPLIISNNHVLANADGANYNDPIIQPGQWDGGEVDTDIIARLVKWVPIKRCNKYDLDAENCPINYIDAAVARVTTDDIDLSTDVQGNPEPQNIATAYIDQSVYKVGRTTGYTDGRVILLAQEIYVYGYSGGVARFQDQIITMKMIDAGDSGSLLREAGTGNAVGLYFAGNDNVSVANPIDRVQRALCISFSPDDLFCRQIFFPIMRHNK